MKGTYCGWTDRELNAVGLAQVQELKSKLAELPVDRIYASPLRRAVQTAEIINETRKAPVVFAEELKERNFGIWEDLTYEEIAGRYPAEYGLWCGDWQGYVIPGGESAVQMFERNCRFAEGLMGKHKDGIIAVVTHQGSIRNILAYLLKLGIEGSWRFKADTASLSIVEVSEGYAVLTALNR